MATRVIRENEIVLNSIKFPIDGFIRESLISRFPAKMIVGDYDYSNEQILSNWIINDQKGGLLIEEMDESIHQDRYWWSTCETRFRSNILLPPLATLISLPAAYSMAITNSDMELTTGWTNGARSSVQKHGGTYSWYVYPTDAYQDLTWDTWLQGKAITFKCWGYTANTATNPCKIGLNDGVTTTWSSVVSASSTWEQLTVTKTLAANATRLRLVLFAGVDTNAVYYDDATMNPDLSHTPGNVVAMVEFDSDLYYASNDALLKLNATGDGFTRVWGFNGTAITKLLVSNDNNLLVFLGDSTNYWYMSTADAWTQTDVALANLGVRWDGKTWKMAVDGRWWSATSPGAASPTWTAADASGGIDDYGLTPKSLEVYRDADGNLIPYCATTRGLYAFSSTNAKWIETEVSLPEHDQTGLGLIVWQDAIFVSGGLSVKKYIAADTATLAEVGLAQDDGLPQLRSGEIVKLIKGYDEFFALIDSTYEGTTSRSQVVSYDGRGWRTWWEATADNKNMYSGIVSSVVAHRLWFSTTDGVYYIPLQRTGTNPKKVASYTYAASSTHITPRFDAGTKAFPKLATKLTVFLDDMSADETVTVTYQIDQAQGALTSAWTALMSAQIADGIASQTFGTSGVGVVFYDIQFRLALARAAGTNTNSPIIKGMTLSFLKLLGRKKAWSFTINTAEAGRVSATPKELTDAIATILATNTLMLFTFRDGSASADTHYVMIQPYYGFTPTGPNWQGTFNLTCVEI